MRTAHGYSADALRSGEGEAAQPVAEFAQHAPGIDWAAWVVVVGYVAGRLLEGLFLLAFKMESHCWRPVDSLFRTITARRNPNLIFLSVGAIAGRALYENKFDFKKAQSAADKAVGKA